MYIVQSYFLFLRINGLHFSSVNHKSWENVCFIISLCFGTKHTYLKTLKNEYFLLNVHHFQTFIPAKINNMPPEIL